MGLVSSEQTGSRVAARIFQSREVGWRSQCFAPKGSMVLTSCEAEIRWGAGGGGEGKEEGAPYRITAFFKRAHTAKTTE